jgi:hypothetical protein
VPKRHKGQNEEKFMQKERAVRPTAFSTSSGFELINPFEPDSIQGVTHETRYQQTQMSRSKRDVQSDPSLPNRGNFIYS